MTKHKTEHVKSGRHDEYGGAAVDGRRDRGLLGPPGSAHRDDDDATDVRVTSVAPSISNDVGNRKETER